MNKEIEALLDQLAKWTPVVEPIHFRKQLYKAAEIIQQQQTVINQLLYEASQKDA